MILTIIILGVFVLGLLTFIQAAPKLWGAIKQGWTSGWNQEREKHKHD